MASQIDPCLSVLHCFGERFGLSLRQFALVGGGCVKLGLLVYPSSALVSWYFKVVVVVLGLRRRILVVSALSVVVLGHSAETEVCASELFHQTIWQLILFYLFLVVVLLINSLHGL